MSADIQEKVSKFEDAFDRPCRVTIYGDGSGCLEYSHFDGWKHAASFESHSEFLAVDPEKLREALNL